MATFKDAADQTWLIAIDGPTIKEVRATTKKELGQEIDLADKEGTSYDFLSQDECALVTVMYLLCSKQVHDRGMTELDFAKALVGDALDRAIKALLEAITDFFPQRSRTLLQSVVAKQDKIRQMGHLKAMQTINDPELEARLTAALEQRMASEVEAALTQLTNATGSPGSSESVLAA